MKNSEVCAKQQFEVLPTFSLSKFPGSAILLREHDSLTKLLSSPKSTILAVRLHLFGEKVGKTYILRYSSDEA